MLNVLLVTRIKGLEEELRGRSLPDVQLTRTRSDVDTRAAIARAEVIVADPVLVASHLQPATSLRWLQSTFAGVDAIFRFSTRRDYRLTRIQGLFGPFIAEYVLLHILARERRLFALAEQQRRRAWKVERYRRLSDLTLGLLGVGDIGREVARAAKAFGMAVWGLRTRAGEVPVVDRIFTTDRLDEFLAGPDYLVNTLPGTEATRGLLSGERLRSCRPEAVLINVGRGDVIDEDSLVRAVREGWIAGAVLDVFPEEPLPEDSPLWSLSAAPAGRDERQAGLPAVTVTPHVAALGVPGEIADIFVTNLEHYRSGEPLLYQVDWGRGY